MVGEDLLVLTGGVEGDEGSMEERIHGGLCIDSYFRG